MPDAKSWLIGSSADCDIVVAGAFISRRHCRLTRNGEQYVLEDLGSTNGTYVNARRIEEPTVVRTGASIVLGRSEFTLDENGALRESGWQDRLRIDARGISVDVRGKRLLEDVSLTVLPGEFVGILGPSGAGKTTLLNALNGYTPPSRGAALIGGYDLYAHYDRFRGRIGYVPQDDIMHRDLTVGEALYYSARLRLPSDFRPSRGWADINAHIARILSELGLESAGNVLIGSPTKRGISGGQRKRVNLAMELLTNPPVMFLDEPTSGLSSEDALNVMKVLRRLAGDGRTILMTIHQPSPEAYRLLDHLVVVAKDSSGGEPGRLAYFGPAYPDAIHFFAGDSTESSPDAILRGLAKEPTAAWIERYRQSTYKQEFVDERLRQKPVQLTDEQNTVSAKQQGGLRWRQCVTLVRRCLSIKRKDRTNTAILLAQAPIIAIIIVFVFGGDSRNDMTGDNWRSGAQAATKTTFLLALAALWFGCSNAVREIVGEWAIYRRERMVNLGIGAYVTSKFIVLGVLCVFQCVLLLSIVGWGAGLQGKIGASFLVLLLAAFVGLGIGLVVSAAARTSEVAVGLLPLILLPMVILGGVLQPVAQMSPPLRLGAHLTPSRWAFEGLLLLESDARPQGTPLGGSAATRAKRQDVAEHWFGEESGRTSIPICTLMLASMFVMLAGAVVGILRARDIH